jgi:hypothetical protein
LCRFALIDDVGVAKNASRTVAIAMLFFGGLALGRYAGYGSWKVGLMMAGWARRSCSRSTRWADEDRAVRFRAWRRP